MEEQKKNGFSLLWTSIMCGLAFFIWLLNRINVFIVDKHLMNRFIMGVVATIIFLSVMLLIFGMKRPFMKYIIILGPLLLAGLANTFLSYHAVLCFAFPILIVLNYDNKGMLIYTYVVTFFIMWASTILGYYYGLCDANMVFLTRSPLSEYLIEGGSAAYMGPLNSNPPLTITLYYVFPREMLLLGFLPIITHTKNSFADYKLREDKLAKLGEHDEMTGLYNRNKFDIMVQDYYKDIENIGVIFWDINDLKRTNDTLGHDAGDQLIKSIALTIAELTNERTNAFRLGGDEFVALVENPNPGEILILARIWQDKMKELNEHAPFPMSAAVGTIEGPGSDIDFLVKAADKIMYGKKEKSR